MYTSCFYCCGSFYLYHHDYVWNIFAGPVLVFKKNPQRILFGFVQTAPNQKKRRKRKKRNRSRKHSVEVRAFWSNVTNCCCFCFSALSFSVISRHNRATTQLRFQLHISCVPVKPSRIETVPGQT